jgi:hypothetical protein
LFGDQFQTAAAFTEWVRAERASVHFGDLVRRSHPHLSMAEIDRIYGTINGDHTLGSIFPAGGYSGASHHMFVVRDQMAPAGMYVGATGPVPLAQSADLVMMGQGFTTGPLAEMAFIQFMLNAGMSPDFQGQTIDPTNPSTFYSRIPSGSFNPRLGGEEAIVSQILASLGYNSAQVTELQITQLAHLLRASGAPYAQVPLGATLFNQQNWDNNVYWGLHNNPPDSPHTRPLRSNFTWNAAYDGIPATDCTTFMRIGWSLGQAGNAGAPTRGGPVSSTYQAVGRSFSVVHNGVTLDATLVQLDLSGRPVEPGTAMQPSTSPPNTAWPGTKTEWSQTPVEWTRVLQPGDIIIRPGHAETFFGVNRTSQRIQIPPHLNRTQFNNVAPTLNLEPGQSVFIGQNGVLGHGGIHNLRNNNRNDGEWMRQDYHAFRIKFHIR